ncbi:MAG: right-handed parallel beta-helix repeat-containing protein, partial [Rubrobacter sp.]
DLTNCSGNGLVIGADGITLDLNGHVIDGNGQGSGVLNNGFDSVAITNGTVQEFDNGVQLNAGTALNIVSSLTLQMHQVAGIGLSNADNGTDGNVIRTNNVTDNELGILLANGTQGATVRDNSLNSNSRDGIRIENSTGNRVEENLVTGSSTAGVALSGGGSNTLIGNTLSANSSGGVTIELASNNNRVEANTISGSGSDGIQVVDSNGSTLISNTVNTSGGTGISLDGANQGVLRDNEVGLNPGGIELGGSSNNLIEANNASGTTGTGISLESESFDNEIRLNTANGNSGAGLEVSGSAPNGSGNLIDGNTVNNNGDGIDVADGGHRIANNTANLNDGWGIYAVSGNTDGGGNKASGNAEPAQCSGVRCEIGPAPGAPDTQIIDRPTNPTSSRNAMFTFTGTDDTTPLKDLDFECRLDSQSDTAWVECENPQEYANLSPGTHKFEVRAMDATENVDPTPATYTWNYQALPSGVAPDTSIDLKPANPTPLLEALFTFTSNEPDVRFECKLDDGLFAPCEFAAEYEFDETEAGRHTFQVRAIDFEGNADPTPATYTWTITGVVTTFLSGPAFERGEGGDPPNGGETESTNATFEFEANVGDATFECSLDLGPFQPCESPVEYTNLAVGEHLLRVIATDNEGVTEVEPAEYEWTVVSSLDTVPPNTTITETPANINDSPVFRFTGTDNETSPNGLVFECSIDSTGESDFQECPSPHTFPNLDLPEPLTPGEHTFYVRAVDLEDNIDPSPASHTWTFRGDTTAPVATVLTGPQARTQNTDARFTFSANDPFATFECSLDGTAFEPCESPHEVQGLVAGKHELRVRTTDLTGNVGSPAAYSWTVVGPPETTIDSGPDTTSTSATFTFSSSEPGSTFECKLDTGAFEPCASPKEYKNLSVGEHDFHVRATDGAGNTDQEPEVYEWTVEQAPPDCTSPGAVSTNADSWINRGSPSDNKGTDSDLRVMSNQGSDLRALVRFPLPNVPQGCVTESAKLRMFAGSARTGRTLQALRISGNWSESSVTWNNQPQTAGSAATTSSGTGWREWD